MKRYAHVLALILVGAFAAPPAWSAGSGADPELIKKLQAELCADPALNKKPETGGGSGPGPKETPKPATLEAKAICQECEAKEATDSTKLKDVEQKVAPIAKVVDAALEKERVKRELAYFKRFGSLYGGSSSDSIENMKETLKYYKSNLDATKLNLEKYGKEQEKFGSLSAALSAFEKSEGDLSADQKKAFIELFNPDIQRLNADATAYASTIKNYKAKIEQYDKPGSSYSAYYINGWKSDLKTYETAYEDRKEKASNLQEFVDWAQSPETSARPSQKSIAAANERIVKRLSELKANSESFASSVKSTEKYISDLEAKIKAKDEELAKATTSDDESEDLKELKKYEKQANHPYAQSNSGFNTCGMSPAEVHALANYTGNGYGSLNAALRKGGDQAKENGYGEFEAVLNSALDKLKSYEGNVNRGAELPQAVADQHKVGDIVTYTAFTSASLGSGFGRKHRFVIKSKTGKYVAPLSVNYSEQEVIFKSNTKFKILSREDKLGFTEIVMEEVPAENASTGGSVQ